MSNIWCAGGIATSNLLRICKSTDEGVNWTTVKSFASPYYSASRFGMVTLNDDAIVIVAAAASSGGVARSILRSIDGGVNFTVVFDYSANSVVNIVKSPVSNYLFAAFNRTTQQFLKSIDEGANWTMVTVGAVPAEDVSFISDTVGFLLTTLAIWKTTDGGDTWTSKKTGLTDMKGIFALDANNIWAVSGDPTEGVWRSTDGGENWTEYAHGGAYGLHSVFAYDATHVWAAGGQASLVYVIYSTDGGQTWITQSVADAGGAQADNYGHLIFLNNVVGFLAGRRLFKTTDGGQTWIEKGTPPFYYVQFANWFNLEFAVQWRAFNITGAEPTDRTTEGIAISASNSLNFGSVGGGSNSAVKCLIFRAVGLGVYTTISDMRAWLQSKDLVGTNFYYMDITNTWTQNKILDQVAAGTPGTCPQSLPGAANLTKIGGGDITGVGHADTSQYVYVCQAIGGDEVGGVDIDMNYRVQADKA
jgi:photosystem II stability/assembly factor-like uncharacterized protein